MNENEVRKEIEEIKKRLSVLEGSRQEQNVVPIREEAEGKEISLKEFILSKEPKSDTQRTLAIGYFLENYIKKAEFTGDDIADAYRQAREPVPMNISDMLAKNARAGFIMAGKEKKEGRKTWTLTNTGVRIAVAGFKGSKKVGRKKGFRIKNVKVMAVAGT